MTKTTKLISTTLALAAFTMLGYGCTLQEANEGASPSPDAGAATPLPAASAAVAGGSPDGGGTTGSAVNPTVPPSDATGEAHGGGQGPTAGAMGAPGNDPGGAPMMPPMMGGNMSAPLTATPAMDKKIADAEKAGDKKKIGAAYAERGTARMTDDASGPRVKYRAALDDYRKALKADPTNAEATKNKKQIEDIYTSMGRPIPGA